MFSQVLRFVRLPLVLILIYAVMRLVLGLRGVPYAPRGNAVFSVVGLTFVSSAIWGALSRKVGGFGWLGTVLTGVALGLWSQILIFAATVLSVAMHLTTSYYVHWDALNLPPDAPFPTMAQVLAIRGGGLVIGPIIAAVLACVGRLLFGPLAPAPGGERVVR
ncbi:MAG TPA: hypothetical protein VF546_10170 [Pyrinomonadaceae bacterium]|jgi:hypothetical protein